LDNQATYNDSDFTEKYNTYGDLLFRICIGYLGSKEDAEEVTQDSFVKLICDAPRFNDGEHEKAWLIRITVNACKNVFKSRRHRRTVNIDEIAEYSDNPSDDSIMDEIVRLPAKYKAVIHLYYYEEYPVKEIARILMISESAVKMRLKRGREILKMEMESGSI